MWVTHIEHHNVTILQTPQSIFSFAFTTSLRTNQERSINQKKEHFVWSIFLGLLEYSQFNNLPHTGKTKLVLMDKASHLAQIENTREIQGSVEKMISKILFCNQALHFSFGQKSYSSKTKAKMFQVLSCHICPVPSPYGSPQQRVRFLAGHVVDDLPDRVSCTFGSHAVYCSRVYPIFDCRQNSTLALQEIVSFG